MDLRLETGWGKTVSLDAVGNFAAEISVDETIDAEASADEVIAAATFADEAIAAESSAEESSVDKVIADESSAEEAIAVAKRERDLAGVKDLADQDVYNVDYHHRLELGLKAPAVKSN